MFCDALGPHGSPTSDSERTMVTETTKNIIVIIISFGGADGLESWAQRVSLQLEQYASGGNIGARVF